MHLASYGGRDDGLYAGAIGESIFFPAQPSVSDLEYQLDRTMEKAGCDRSKDRMRCLRGKSLKKLQRLNRSGPFPGQTVDPLFYWTPCIDGEFLQDLPYKLFESRRTVKVPIMAGSCTNEGSVFAPHEASTAKDVINFFKINYPTMTEADMNSLLVLYPLEFPLPFHESWYPTASRAYGDATFICPTNNILNSLAVKRNESTPALMKVSPVPNIWSYRYNVEDTELVESGLGVPHVFESPAVFGPAMLPPPVVPQSYWTYNAPVVPMVMKYWLSFVMTLNPNTHKDPGAPVWKPWGRSQNRLLIELGTSQMETVDELEQERCSFWKDIAGDTQQ
jgi:acetylcholinesterase